MKHIDKKLALIAKEKSFNEDVDYYYMYYDKIVNKYSQEFEESYDTEINSINTIKLPNYEQLITWIFNHCDNLKLYEQIEWLQFWYNILITEFIICIDNDNNELPFGLNLETFIDYKQNLNIKKLNINNQLKEEYKLYENYNIKIKNEIILNGFMTTMLDWFSDNNIVGNIYRCSIFNNHYNYEIIINKDFDNIIKGNNDKKMNKYQAFHKLIIECFKLII